MRKLYGETEINKIESENTNKNSLINLKYYKTKNLMTKYSKRKYGIEIIKREISQRGKKKERAITKYISNSEQVIDKLLALLVENKVTPIGINDVLIELTMKFEFKS